MFQPIYHSPGGRFVVHNDGRVSGFSQPEPEFLQRKYRHGQALRELKQSRVDAAQRQESRGFVERIRVALGIS